MLACKFHPPTLFGAKIILETFFKFKYFRGFYDTIALKYFLFGRKGSFVRQLEAFYESTPKAIGFVGRKIQIPSRSINLCAPPKSGKTWLVLDYLSKIPKKKRLYIDLRDLRVDKRSLKRDLQKFIEDNNIECVAIDHYEASVPVPRCKQTIIVSDSPATDIHMIPLLELEPLDFEEYLAFEKRHIHLEHSFSLYLRTGSLPAMAGVHESLLTLSLHEEARTIFSLESELALFKYLSRYQGKPITPYQLYTVVKKEHKISKDRLYATVKSFQERRIISWVSKLDQPKAAKRVTFYDFAMPASMYFEKSLMGQLYSIAAARMRKKKIEPFYTDKIDLLDPDKRHAVVISPFANQQNSAAKISRLIDEIDRYDIQKVTVLTISNSFGFTFENIEVKALPFYEWILQD